MVGNRAFKWLTLPLAAVVIHALVSGPPRAAAQTPPPSVTPPVETPATPGGLGDCQEGWKVAVLNDEFNALPEDQSKRSGNGGFETFIVTNCKAYLMNYEVIDQYGQVVAGAAGSYLIDNYDDVDWIDLQTIQYQRHTADVYDPVTGRLLHSEGDVVTDADGNAVPATAQPDPVTAYRFKFEFANDPVDVGGEMLRPLENNQDYQLKIEIVPYAGAPPNHIFSWVFEIVAKLSGNWWQKIIRVLSPINWLAEGLTFVFRGYGAAIHGAMCVTMGNFMTSQERLAFTRYDSDGDGKITKSDDKVGNADDPGKPNANGNCKEPAKSPEEELEELRTANYNHVDRQRAIAGLPPLPRPAMQRDTYLFEVIDGHDPRDRSRTFGERVNFEISHLTLAPRLAANSVAAAPVRGVHGGITTFTGLLTGTPPELTYERGIVRIGWSVIFNITLVVVVLVIAWIGFTQVLRVFLGTRGLADWRETIPRLILAVMGALLSYWFCSICIDVADGISRYIAAAMRITPADITLVLGQALVAILLKNVQHAWLASIPVAGFILVGLKVAIVGALVLLMKVFAIAVLLVVAQFVMRIGLLCLLIVTSPLGMLMWALPETAGWGRRWVSLFFTTLFQHGLQLICFAIALWFVRLATPVGIVADTGAVSGALEAVLPTKMAYSLILGTILMIVTFKIPSMLGQGGLQESFVSTISMAALGARALGFIAGGAGGGSGPLAWLGMGRGPNLGPSLSPGGLASGEETRGVTTGITAAASNTFVGGLVGTARAAQTAAAHITGNESWAPQASAGEGSVSQGEPSSLGDSGQEGAEGVERSATGSQAFVGAPSSQSQYRQDTAGMSPEERRTADVGHVRTKLGSSYVNQGRSSQTQAISPYYVREGGPDGSIRATSAAERSVIRDMGTDRFNEVMNPRRPRPAPRAAAHSQEGGAAGQRTDPGVEADRHRGRQVMRPQNFNAGQGSIRSVNQNYVRENGQVRLATPAERSLMREMGRSRFDRMMGTQVGRTSTPAAQRSQGVGASRESVSERQAYFDSRRAREAMGEERYGEAREQNLRVMPGGATVMRDGQIRMPSPQERKLISEMGSERFNRIFAPRAQGAAQGQDVAQVEARDATPRMDSGERRQGLGERMRQSFREGFQSYRQGAQVPLIRQRDGRVVPETSEGLIAKRTLGDEEYSRSANREVLYVGSGSWMNVAGNPRPLTSDQSFARNVMGNEEFTRSAQNSIRSEGKTDSGGRALVTENGQERLATRAEQRLMSPEGLGRDRFNRVMGEQTQFMGEGHFVRDERTLRLASENESRLFDQIGEERFNDVMGRRFEEAGTGYRVDAAPSREEVLGQMRRDSAWVAREVGDRGGDLLDRGRHAVQDSGIRRESLSDVGGAVGGEVRGGDERPQYDAEQQRRMERERQNRERFYGFRTELE